ncbi:MAG: nuclear transport factor 2 family protein [Phycisphaerales bacterium]
MRSLILAALFTTPAVADQVIHSVPFDANYSLTATYSYADGTDLHKPHPVLVAFPPGNQNAQMEGSTRAMFYNECVKRGWVLVTPQSPDGTLLFQKPEMFKALVADMDKTLVAEGGKYHVAGASNGGRTALNFALEYPNRTASATGFPGAWFHPPSETETIERLKGIPIRLWCGSDDTVEWLDATHGMEAFAKRSNGKINAKVTIIPAEGHVLRSLTATTILDEIEKTRTPDAPANVSRASLDAALVVDALHAAASKADFDGYFALFAPDAIFIGTDAGERWTVEQFKSYAKPVFAKPNGKGGWTYVPRQGSRHFTVIPGTKGEEDATTVFFDELLDNENYGTTRGTGVVRKVTTGEGENAKTEWKIAQYSLSIPIPNPIAKRVATMVKAEEKRADEKKKP